MWRVIWFWYWVHLGISKECPFYVAWVWIQHEISVRKSVKHIGPGQPAFPVNNHPAMSLDLEYFQYYQLSITVLHTQDFKKYKIKTKLWIKIIEEKNCRVLAHKIVGWAFWTEPTPFWLDCFLFSICTIQIYANNVIIKPFKILPSQVNKRLTTKSCGFSSLQDTTSLKTWAVHIGKPF